MSESQLSKHTLEKLKQNFNDSDDTPVRRASSDQAQKVNESEEYQSNESEQKNNRIQINELINMSKDQLIKELGKFMPDQLQTLKMMERNDIVNLLKQMMVEQQEQPQQSMKETQQRNSKPSNQRSERNQPDQKNDKIKLKKQKHKEMIEKVIQTQPELRSAIQSMPQQELEQFLDDFIAQQEAALNKQREKQKQNQRSKKNPIVEKTSKILPNQNRQNRQNRPLDSKNSVNERRAQSSFDSMKSKIFSKPAEQKLKKPKIQQKKIFSSDGLNFDFKKDLPQVEVNQNMKPFDKKPEKQKKSTPVFDQTKKLNIVNSRAESPIPLKPKKKKQQVSQDSVDEIINSLLKQMPEFEKQIRSMSKSEIMTLYRQAQQQNNLGQTQRPLRQQQSLGKHKRSFPASQNSDDDYQKTQGKFQLKNKSKIKKKSVSDESQHSDPEKVAKNKFKKHFGFGPDEPKRNGTSIPKNANENNVQIHQKGPNSEVIFIVVRNFAQKPDGNNLKKTKMNQDLGSLTNGIMKVLNDYQNGNL